MIGICRRGSGSRCHSLQLKMPLESIRILPIKKRSQSALCNVSKQVPLNSGTRAVMAASSIKSSGATSSQLLLGRSQQRPDRSYAEILERPSRHVSGITPNPASKLPRNFCILRQVSKASCNAAILKSKCYLSMPGPGWNLVIVDVSVLPARQLNTSALSAEIPCSDMFVSPNFF